MKKIFNHSDCFYFLICIYCSVGFVTTAWTATARAEVSVSAIDISSCDATPGQCTEIADAIRALWTTYLHMDQAGLNIFLTPDIVRMSQRAQTLQRGQLAVLDGITKEWESFERPDGVLSEQMRMNQAQVRVDASGDNAVVVYSVEVEGGARWHYDDQAIILQIFLRKDGAWRVAFWVEVWSLEKTSSTRASGTFAFDFVYPVKDLKRAVAFYEPLLGQPESITSSRAVFSLKGAHFILDADGLEGLADVRAALPNGFAEFQVQDLNAARARLLDEGVVFLAGTDTAVKKRGEDRFVIAQDISENVFVLVEQCLETKHAPAPILKGLDGADPYLQSARRMASAWLAQEAATIVSAHLADGGWLDDTRTKRRGLEAISDISAALPEHYWSLYDRGKGGLAVHMEVSHVQKQVFGAYTVVSYERHLTGMGPHVYGETAFVSHVFLSPDEVLYSWVAQSSLKVPDGMALELDYTAYPVTNLDHAADFYTDILRLGRPYRDENWRGYWSHEAVFGVYGASVADDGVPQMSKSNGYASLWVKSAADAHAYLKRQGATFPVIPSINEKEGIDPEPGYIQVVTTDSEGNLLILTEYTGKRTR